MLMAVLAIEWSLLVHGFLHLHYDVCDVNNFGVNSDQNSVSLVGQNASNLQERYDDLESLHNIDNEDITNDDRFQIEDHINATEQGNIRISQNRCNPSWPWININLHRSIAMMMIMMRMMMMMTMSMIMLGMMMMMMMMMLGMI